MGLDMYAHATLPKTFEPLPLSPFDARIAAGERVYYSEPGAKEYFEARKARHARWLNEIGVKLDSEREKYGGIHYWRKHYRFLQWLEELGTGETVDDWMEADRKAGKEPQQYMDHFAISLTGDNVNRLEDAVINDELPNDGRCEAFHEGMLAEVAGVISAHLGPGTKLVSSDPPPAKLPPGAMPHGRDLAIANWRRDDDLAFVDKARRILVAGGKVSIGASW